MYQSCDRVFPSSYVPTHIARRVSSHRGYSPYMCGAREPSLPIFQSIFENDILSSSSSSSTLPPPCVKDKCII